MFRSRLSIKAGKTFLDLSVLGGAFCLAFVLRFERSLSDAVLEMMLLSLPLVLLTKVACFLAFGVRRLTWRYVSLREAKRILTSLTIAMLTLASLRGLLSLWTAAPPLTHYATIPFGVLLIDLPLSFLGILGMRVVVRSWNERREGRPTRLSRAQKVPTLLIGAGHAGALVAKEISARPDMDLAAVGFLDDDPTKLGMVVHDVPVLGPIQRIREIAQTVRARQALITMAGTPGLAVRRIVRLCEECGIAAKVIPELRDIVDGKVNLTAIRDVAIEDLLCRAPVQLDSAAIAGVVQGRRVLVTGAGGSIGSELCREVCRFEPAFLTLVEQAENNLFHIHRELCERFAGRELVPAIADICDSDRLRQIFARYRPEVVFHAAAHKHVPLMEWNPGEAIKNNVLGTQNLADLAHAYEVDQFVMISTDKAVNPTSVMGVTKRISEMYIQALAQRSETRFVAVRFGNVLGSAGSVIPIFKEQIAKGGPVTVTHPDMKRYFMTIPEACQLVLQAASMGRGGEIYILDMGEPVKIVDLARDLIQLSGLQPDKDIEIRYTGIRPGEKLFEELSLPEESAEKTTHPRIFIGRLRPYDWHEVSRQIAELAVLASEAPERIHGKFKEIVPEYRFVQAASVLPRATVRAHRAHDFAPSNGTDQEQPPVPPAVAPISGLA